MLSLLFVLSCFFDDNEGQLWTTLFGNRNVVFVVCVVVIFFTTTRDNLGQHFLEIEMLSLLSMLSFFRRQRGTTLDKTFWNKKEMLSLLSMLSFFRRQRGTT